jgi:RNA polymerase sigma-70 factor, ECF subfamily
MKEKIDDFVANDYARVVAAVGIVTDEPDLADEGVQTALVKVITNNKQHDALAARVAIVATGEVRLIARRRMNEKLSGVPSSAPTDTPAPLVQSAPIVGAVRQLSQRQREMALIHYYLGTSITDLADVSYLNQSTVETHIDQARRSIAEYLVNAPKVTASSPATSSDLIADTEVLSDAGTDEVTANMPLDSPSEPLSTTLEPEGAFEDVRSEGKKE